MSKYWCTILTIFVLLELGLQDGHEIVVADVTTPKPVSLAIKYIDKME